MPITIPSWLKAPDVAGEYTKGLQIGAGVQQAQARLAQAREEAAMQAQVKQQQLQQAAQMANARMQTEQAYRQAQIGLSEQRLQQVGQQNQMRTQAAAQKLAAQTKYANLKAENPDMPESEALWKSGLGSAANIVTSRGQEQSAAFHAQDYTMRQQMEKRRQESEDRRQKALDMQADKPVVVGSETTADATGDVTKTTRKNIYGQPGITPPPKTNRFRYDPAKDELKPFQ